MNKEKLFKILLSPSITEKSNALMAGRKYVFRVMSNATKPEVAEAVKTLFKVEVEKVGVCNCKGKKRKFGRFEGCRKDWKKAYVTLKDGYAINLGVA
jgi:large subunit ribosomal protein L23